MGTPDSPIRLFSISRDISSVDDGGLIENFLRFSDSNFL
jgi:hypothetical protein